MKCIHCGCLISAVYIQYSPGNIRLVKCEKCKSIADEYVEYEPLIIVIDLILHKMEVYRHLLFNSSLSHDKDMKNVLWKANLLFLLLDSHKKTLPCMGGSGRIRWEGISTFVFTASKVLTKEAISSAFYVALCMIISKFVISRRYQQNLKCKDYLLAITVSNFFKFLTFTTMLLYCIILDCQKEDESESKVFKDCKEDYHYPEMVWEFSPLMLHMIEMLLVSSNIVALKVMLNTSTMISTSIVTVSALGRFLVARILYR